MDSMCFLYRGWNTANPTVRTAATAKTAATKTVVFFTPKKYESILITGLGRIKRPFISSRYNYSAKSRLSDISDGYMQSLQQKTTLLSIHKKGMGIGFDSLWLV